MRAAVGLGDVEVDEERGDGLRSHAGAAIGMEREGPGRDVFFLQGIGDELLGEFGGLPMSDQPTDDIAAVDVEDHVEMEAGPFGRALQFGDIPGPHFVGPDRQEFGLGVERMDALTPALAGLAAGRPGADTWYGSSRDSGLHRATWHRPRPAPCRRSARCREGPATDPARRSRAPTGAAPAMRAATRSRCAGCDRGTRSRGSARTPDRHSSSRHVEASSATASITRPRCCRPPSAAPVPRTVFFGRR